MRRLHGIIGILVLLVALAGCGTTTATGRGGTLSSTGTGRGAAPTPTIPSTPTSTPVSSAAAAACFGPTVAPSQVIQSGDILISPVKLGPIAYPSVALPQDAPTDKPYRVSSAGKAAYASDFPSSPITNPTDDMYAVTVCNASSSQSHTLQAISARTTNFTAYSGQLNSWQWCDGALDSHNIVEGTGCGGGLGPGMYFDAAFSSSSAGTLVTTTQDTAMLPAVLSDYDGTLPFTMKPGLSVTLFISMHTPSAGTYTFAAGFTFDDASAFYSDSGPVTLIAPVSHKWTGAACQQPALEAQITPTTPETYYICAQ